VASHYYLASQLPYLLYGQSASMSSSYFKELCRDHLDEKELQLLELCNLNPFSSQKNDDASDADVSVSSPFIESWRSWEKTLRLHLAKFRAQNLKRDTSSLEDAPSDPLEAATIAKTAVTMDSPLEAEMYLDKARWDYIDSLEGLDHFSDNAIFAYLLKLYLIERFAQFKEDEGFEEYKLLYASIIDNQSIDTESGEPK
jgi:hypothetical protein